MAPSLYVNSELVIGAFYCLQLIAQVSFFRFIGECLLGQCKRQCANRRFVVYSRIQEQTTVLIMLPVPVTQCGRLEEEGDGVMEDRRHGMRHRDTEHRWAKL